MGVPEHATEEKITQTIAPTIIADAMALTEIAYVIACKQERDEWVLSNIQTCYQKLRFLFGAADQTILRDAQQRHQAAYQTMIENPPSLEDAEYQAFKEKATKANVAVFGEHDNWDDENSQYMQTPLRTDWQAYNDHEKGSGAWNAAHQIAIQTVQSERTLETGTHNTKKCYKAMLFQGEPNLRNDIMVGLLIEAYRTQHEETTDRTEINVIDPDAGPMIPADLVATPPGIDKNTTRDDKATLIPKRNMRLLLLAVLVAAGLAAVLVFGFPVLAPIAGLSLAAWKALCVLSFAAAPIGIRLFAHTMATPSDQMPGGQVGRAAFTVLSVILSTAFLIFAIPMVLAPLGAKAALATYTHLQHVAIGAGMVDAMLATGAGVAVCTFGSQQRAKDGTIDRGQHGGPTGIYTRRNPAQATTGTHTLGDGAPLDPDTTPNPHGNDGDGGALPEPILS